MTTIKSFDELPEEIKYIYFFMRDNHPEETYDQIKQKLVNCHNAYLKVIDENR